MEKIAFISGGTFVYWSSIILALAAATAALAFLALYLGKSGNPFAAFLAVPVAIVLSALLGRMVHWYCRADGYPSFAAAMTDYSWGSFALMGIFAGCLLTGVLLRVLRISRNLPQMLDSAALAGGVGIAVGRLAFFFNSSDRGLIVPDGWGLPFAYPVTNPVSGLVENRLATFLLQGIVTGIIVLALLLYIAVMKQKRHRLKDGDVCLLFLTAYCCSQILFDSTRYDSLFMRSNGFVSIVQILCAVVLVTAVVLFSVRMIRGSGFKKRYIWLWVGFLAFTGGAGFMEYYVQRHGDMADFAYGVMGSCLVAMLALVLMMRHLAVRRELRRKVRV